MLHFECPSCKTKGEAAPDLAGKTIVCPKCSQNVTVPKDAAAITAAAPAPAPPSPSTGVTTPAVADAQQAKKRARDQHTGGPGTSIAKDGDASGNWLKYALPAVVVLIVLAFIAAWAMQGGGPNPVVVMETSMGNIKIELYQDKAPVTVENFLQYVDEKHYDGTIFHRVIADFMIQGGGFEPGLRPKRTKHTPIRNEAGNRLSNERGTIAMARTNDPDSATDQFFINVNDNAGRGLDRKGQNAGYAVFGRVIDGMDVADKIRAVKTGSVGGHDDVPINDVIIKSVRRVESK